MQWFLFLLLHIPHFASTHPAHLCCLYFLRFTLRRCTTPPSAPRHAMAPKVGQKGKAKEGPREDTLAELRLKFARFKS